MLTISTKNKSILAFFTKVVVGSAIMTVSAQVTIPLPFVPITGQTLGLMIVSLSMGSKIAVSSLIFYILQGILGFPVFANFGSIANLLGPSGGYLWGCIPTAFIMGYYVDRGCLTSVVRSAFAITLGLIVLYAFGLFHLSFFVPTNRLLSIGLYPFVFGEIVKAMIVMFTIPTIHHYFNKIK